MLTLPVLPPVRVLLDGEVGVIVVSGVLTLAVMDEVRREALQRWAGQVPTVIVADLRGAALAVTAPTLTAAVLAAPHLRDVAIAMVARGPAADVLRDHAFLCAHQGVLRVILPDVPAAMEWAREQAVIQRYLASKGE